METIFTRIFALSFDLNISVSRQPWLVWFSLLNPNLSATNSTTRWLASNVATTAPSCYRKMMSSIVFRQFSLFPLSIFFYGSRFLRSVVDVHVAFQNAFVGCRFPSTFVDYHRWSSISHQNTLSKIASTWHIIAFAHGRGLKFCLGMPVGSFSNQKFFSARTEHLEKFFSYTAKVDIEAIFTRLFTLFRLEYLSNRDSYNFSYEIKTCQRQTALQDDLPQMSPPPPLAAIEKWPRQLFVVDRKMTSSIVCRRFLLFQLSFSIIVCRWISVVSFHCRLSSSLVGCRFLCRWSISNVDVHSRSSIFCQKMLSKNASTWYNFATTHARRLKFWMSMPVGSVSYQKFFQLERSTLKKNFHALPKTKWKQFLIDFSLSLFDLNISATNTHMGFLMLSKIVSDSQNCKIA